MTSELKDESTTASAEEEKAEVAKAAPPPITNVVVHPLVLLSCVDHYNRVAKDTNKRVVGALLGETFQGRVDVRRRRLLIREGAFLCGATAFAPLVRFRAGLRIRYTALRGIVRNPVLALRHYLLRAGGLSLCIAMHRSPRSTTLYAACPLFRHCQDHELVRGTLRRG